MGDQAVRQMIVVSQDTINENELSEKSAFFDEEGAPFNIGSVGPQGEPGADGADGADGDDAPAATGANVLLTGLVAGTATAVAATDTVNEAIAKLQAQIDAL